ncbi:hypothetical protein [Fulvimonas soli]|uniref:hypothetical protein n=1 Tax=Fulvimonas soli TaxID=155197 RepID=UPI00111DBC02|nr:hypothetical protein [Fulvimonas soli]TNY27002.1 hypothetical protein BV497_05545 [Fulvimonas soli]
MKRRGLLWLLVPVVVIAAIAGWNYFGVQQPLSKALAADSRNEGLSVFAHYQWYVNADVLVFDLRGVSGTNSEADVFRSMLQFAQAVQSRNFNKVILAYKGTPRFMLEGAYFKQLGVEFAYQNPVYTLRTLPEHVYNLDGTPAFGTWTGGLLGVVGHQMQDLNEFGRQWFINDAAGGN